MDYAIKQHADGVVLVGVGTGNAPLGFVAAVERATAAGIPVVLSTRVAWGPTKAVYAQGGGVDLVKAGAIASGNLNPWQARMLLAVLIANQTNDIAASFATLA